MSRTRALALLILLSSLLIAQPVLAEDVRGKYQRDFRQGSPTAPFPDSIDIFLDGGDRFSVARSAIPIVVRALRDVEPGDRILLRLNRNHEVTQLRKLEDSSETEEEAETEEESERAKIRKFVSALSSGDRAFINGEEAEIIKYDKTTETLHLRWIRQASSASVGLKYIRTAEPVEDIAEESGSETEAENPWKNRYPVTSTVRVNEKQELEGTVFSWRDGILHLRQPDGTIVRLSLDDIETIQKISRDELDFPEEEFPEEEVLAGEEERERFIEEKYGLRCVYVEPEIDWEKNLYGFHATVRHRLTDSVIVDAKLAIGIEGRGMMLAPKREASVVEEAQLAGGIKRYALEEGLLLRQGERASPDLPRPLVLAEAGVAPENLIIKVPPLFPKAAYWFERTTRHLGPQISVQILVDAREGILPLDSSRALPYVAESALSPDLQVRAACVRTLARTKNPALFPYVLAALATEEEDLIIAAREAFIEFGDESLDRTSELLASGDVTLRAPGPKRTVESIPVENKTLLIVRCIELLTETRHTAAKETVLTYLLSEKDAILRAAEDYFLEQPKLALQTFFRHIDESEYSGLLRDLSTDIALRKGSVFAEAVQDFGVPIDETTNESLDKGEASEEKILAILEKIHSLRHERRIEETTKLLADGRVTIKELQAKRKAIDSRTAQMSRLVASLKLKPEKGWDRLQLARLLYRVLLQNPDDEKAKKRLGALYYDVGEELRGGQDGVRNLPSDLAPVLETVQGAANYSLSDEPAPEGWYAVQFRDGTAYVSKAIANLKKRRILVESPMREFDDILRYYRLAKALGGKDEAALTTSVAKLYGTFGHLAYQKEAWNQAFLNYSMANQLAGDKVDVGRRRLITYMKMNPYLLGATALLLLGFLGTGAWFGILYLNWKKD